MVQVCLLHKSESKLEAEQEQAPHFAFADECIPVAVLDGTADVVLLDSEAVVVVEDKGIQHHFVYTIPSWHIYSYTSE